MNIVINIFSNFFEILYIKEDKRNQSLLTQDKLALCSIYVFIVKETIKKLSQNIYFIIQVSFSRLYKPTVTIRKI